MRGWYYFLLAQTYGPTHFTLEPTVGMVTTANKTPVEQIYDQVVTDLRFAADNLPNTQSEYGRITKPGALAILSKVLLTKGDYQEASNIANMVINSFGLSLLPGYGNLWTMANERNSEVLWAVNYANNVALNAGSNVLHSMFLMAYSDLPGMTIDVNNGLPEGRWIPTLFYLNLFDEANDSRFDATFKQAWIANNAATLPKWTTSEAAQNPALAGLVGQNKFAVGDTAIYLSKYSINNSEQNYSIRYRYKTYDIDDLYNSNGTIKNINQYFSLRKFDDPTRATAMEKQSARNANVIRLGEVYLIAAEAQVRLGKADSAAFL
ncbi:RagB/SusD family nutrient uptake outer membrane protein [Niabella ginsengisoli]|uniref:RagB/SusD family nutrient uptake outer membrane protein n=1 Tax=Niabella ginsengisoli TaxID=522298 RepID=UPI0021D40BE6|nr:RagB/SusD family nutrient uptake outer membrane protein [Niabella ginsengisoli]